MGFSAEQIIICISDLFWDEHWSSEQQLMSRFAKTYSVLYVERPVSIFSFFTGISDASVARQFLRWLSGGIRGEGDNLFVLTPPPFLPFRYHPIINTINQFVRTWSIKRAMKKLGFTTRPLLWIYEPDAAYSIGKIGELLSIYHCADDWSGSKHWWNPTRAIRKCEESLAGKASVVLTVSKKLFNDKSELNTHTYYMPNGVSFEDFSTCQETPDDMAEILRPIIGCVAVYNDRYDYNLLETVARAKPDWSFVFVGKIVKRSIAIKNLATLPNVLFLGSRSRSLLGNYIRNFDVCLIPYKGSKFNESAFPLKLMEYFFFGKPVVAPRLPSLLEFESLIYNYGDPDGFISAVDQGLYEVGLEKTQQRQTIAMQNTWNVRVKEALEVIGHKLSTKY